MDNQNIGSNLKKWLSFIALAIIVIVLLSSSFTIIPAGHRGVLIQLGKVEGVLNEGLNFKLPFITTVEKMEVRVQKEENTQTASSKDLQTVSTVVAVNFSVSPGSVNKLYQQVGLDYRIRIIDPAVAESVKAVMAKYTAEELITKRPEVSAEIKDMLGKRLNTYYMKLEEINIKDFKFSETFNNAIEAKTAAEQQALKAKRDLDRVNIEAQQKISQAKAEAESLRLKKQEITPELVKLKEIENEEKAIEKWDGKLPQVTSGATPFINLNPSK
jgi:regulator of protease activity HflC (stomatin/prohibitin superfamily)